MPPSAPSPPPPLQKTYTTTHHTYPPCTSFNTLTLHTRTPLPPHPILPLPKTSPSPIKQYNILHIHGGAFRDPLTTSSSLLPSLLLLFQNPHIAQIASVNYRLSPYPTHPTCPSQAGEEYRNVRWPVHLEDVRGAVGWLRETEEGWGGGGRECIVVGHSVGGTMGVMLGLHNNASPSTSTSTTTQDPTSTQIFTAENPPHLQTAALNNIVAIISIEGISDFTALRDAHPSSQETYNEFISAAFGAEEEGGWDEGSLVKILGVGGGMERRGRGERRLRKSVEVVLVVHSPGDELVEWEQAGGMVRALKGGDGREGGEDADDADGRKVKVELVQVEGSHEGVMEGGRVVGEVVGRAVGMLLGREKEGGRGVGEGVR